MSNSEAAKLFLEMSGVNGATPSSLKPRSTSTLDWRACVEAFTDNHVEQLADWRGFSGELVSWLKQSGLVGLHDQCIKFPVHDRAGSVVAVHYRLKDGSWRYHPQGAKVRLFVIGELQPGDHVHVFESQWDAFAFMDVSGERSGIVITRGASREWQAGKAVKLLYIDGEMPADLMRDRCEGLQGSNSQLEFLNHEILFDRTGKALNITNREVQQAITARCVNTGVKVLILDNLSTLASGMKENEADSWELMNNWLLDLRRRKIAVIIVHHAGRSGDMRGTSKREDNVFWIIALDDTKKNADDKRGARFVSRFTKPSRNTQEEVPAYEWHVVTDQATGEISVGCKLAQSLDVFRQCVESGVTENSQLAAELKVSPATISKMAKKAMDQGWLRRQGREYELISTGNEGA